MVKLLIVGAARAPAHTRRAARGTLAAQKVGLSALPLYPALSQDNPAPAAVPPAAALSAAADRLAALLTVACAVLLSLLAAVGVLALQLHFESRDREQLHDHLRAARALLASVDNAGELAALPARLQASFGDEPELAVRVQGALDQTLYEQGEPAALPARLLAHPSAAQPAPLMTWRQDGRAWRGSAVVMRMPMPGAAPLTVAMSLDIQPHEGFMRSFRWALMGYVLLTTLAFALLARWATRRALMRAENY